MTCFQARAYVRLFAGGTWRREALLHAGQCRKCQPGLKAELVLERLFNVTAPADTAPPEDFYQRLRLRIDHEVAFQTSARRVVSSSWEGAVLQFQSWVYAGSLAAVCVLGLIVYSGGFAPQALSGRDRLSDAMISQRSDRMVLTRPDPLSQDEVLFALMSEDY
ncbi:MAG: hypothetical protein ABI882_01190 [Acidobacteriota bacterium]